MRKNSAAYLEMLFEHRNKAYGAYDLRRNYENRLIKSFGIALLIAGFFFLIPFSLTKVLTGMHEEEKVLPSMVYDLTKKYVIEKPQLAVQSTASNAKTISKDIYKIVKNDEASKEPDQEKTKTSDPESPVQGAGSGFSTDSTSTSDASSGNSDSTTAVTYSAASVDVIPSFPGGEEAMLKYLSKNIRYPLPAHNNNIAGRVYVSFIVDEKGKVTEIKIMRGLGYGTEEEVVRVVGNMPDWSPGKYQGRNVKTAFIMPVLFTIK